MSDKLNVGDVGNKDLNLEKFLVVSEGRKSLVRDILFGNKENPNKSVSVTTPEEPKIRFKTRYNGYIDTDMVPLLPIISREYDNSHTKFCNLLYEYKHTKNTTKRKKIFKRLYRIILKYPHIIESRILWYPSTTNPSDFDGDVLPVDGLKNNFISNKIMSIKTFKILVKHMSSNTRILVGKKIVGRYGNKSVDMKRELNKIYGGGAFNEQK